MDFLKKILTRLFAFIVLLILINFVYTQTFWKTDIHKHADLLDSIAKYQDNTDVLFLSSSSNYFHAIDDHSNKRVSDYLSEYYPNLRINAINKGYMHSGIFYSVLQNIPKDSPIKTIIVAINIRSFGPYWLYSDVETAYSAQQLMMNNIYPPIIRRFLLALDYYDNKTKEERIKQYKEAWETDTLIFPYPFPYKTVSEWDYAVAHSGKYKNKNGSLNIDELGFACNLVKFYGYNIDSNHIRIKDLDKIIKLAKERNWKLLFHILPTNLNSAFNLVGQDIPYLLNESANKIKDRYSKSCIFFNNIDLLDESFFYENYPTEHYLPGGKRILAKTLAKELGFIYPKEYKPQKWTYNKANISPKKIKSKIKEIKKNNDWIKAIKVKSKHSGRTENSIYREDASWLLMQEFAKKEETRVNQIISRIKANPEWNQKIIDKAIRNKYSYEKQIKEDAIWIVNSED